MLFMFSTRRYRFPYFREMAYYLGLLGKHSWVFMACGPAMLPIFARLTWILKTKGRGTQCEILRYGSERILFNLEKNDPQAGL